MQWLKLCASNARERAAGLIPGQGAKSPHAMWCGKKNKLKKQTLKSGHDLFLLRVPGTAKRSNQSNLKDINSEYSLEGQMLKLKLQYFGHLM